MTARLRETYKNEVFKAMQDKFQYANVMEVPKLTKITINMGLGEAKENAKILEKYMTDAGFAGLSSEWWHFQDNETRESINLTTYLEGGVSVEGWKCNDRGWRYRLANGEYLKDTTQKIDSTEYSFDEKGYCTPMQNQ